MVQPLWKTAWQFLTKLNIILTRDLAVMLPGVYPNELTTCVHTKTCTQMWIAALFITVKS